MKLFCRLEFLAQLLGQGFEVVMSSVVDSGFLKLSQTVEIEITETSAYGQTAISSVRWILDLHLENSMTYICNLWILIICMD
jgi:hypothetical protein